MENDTYEGELEQADFERELEDAEDGFDEPDHNDAVLCCPDCERPNQFGQICSSCERDRQAEIEKNRL